MASKRGKRSKVSQVRNDATQHKDTRTVEMTPTRKVETFDVADSKVHVVEQMSRLKLPIRQSLQRQTQEKNAKIETAGCGDSKGPAYAKLTKLAFDGPVAKYLQLSVVEDNRNTVDTIVRELVQDSGKAVRNLDGVLDSKVQERVLLLDNPAENGKAVERARRRAKQNLANRSSKHLSKRQHKLIGSYDLPLQYHKFDLFRPMHEMWKAYAKEVVNENRGKMIEPSLLQMDFHGAFLAVVAAKINNQVGVEGIMIRETTKTFAIMTMANKLKVIPKAGSVFALRMDDMGVILYGDRICRGTAMQKP